MIRVVAGAIISHGRVLAAMRPQHAARGGVWEFPGGKVEAGESDAHALARELSEELETLTYVSDRLGEVVHGYDDVTIDLVLYRCRIRAGGPRAVEHEDLRWLAPDELDGIAWADADAKLVGAVRACLEAQA